MEIIINHLTRMKAGFMCVAGIDSQTREHIRFETSARRMEISMLARNEGPFDIGNRIFFKELSPCGVKPHVEDHIYRPEFAHLVETVSGEQFWELLCSVSQTRLRDIFGEELDQIGSRSCGTQEGKGEASLGCLSPKLARNLRIERLWGRQRIRVDVCDEDFIMDLGVTDIRLYQDDHVTPNPKIIEDLANKIQHSDGIMLSVGLGRAYAPKEGSDRFHYLQVNNIHLKENPVRQLG